MANRIRGITVEIGGDTTKLDKALRGTNKELSSTQSALKDVERLLKLDPGNTTLLEQKQRLLASAVDTTAQKLKTLQDAAKTADEALARGKAYEEKYAPLKASLEDVSTRLEKLKGQQDSMDEEFATGKLPDEKYQQFNKTLSETQAEFDALKQAQKEVREEFAGAKLSQEQYDALQREIIDTEENLKDLSKQADKASVSLGKIGAAADSVSGTAGKIKDVMSPVTTGILALGTAALATVPATEELRSDLSKLDTNAQQAGVGVDRAREAFEAFAVATDETDSSVEAVSNLLQAGFTESNLQKAVEGLTGAYLAFPDTLKIESLADSLQETLATGEATGQFGELLDRLGIGAENFSAGLSQITDAASQQQYVLETLSQSGMMDMYNAWVQNNQALVENKDASLEMQQSLAELAETIQPIVTDITQLATKLLDWFNDLSPAGQQVIVTILALVAAIGPIAGIISSIANAISGVSKVAGLFSAGAGNTVWLTFAKWALIITAVAAALAALIAMINILIGKGDDVTASLNAVTGKTGSVTAGTSSSVPQNTTLMRSVMSSAPGFASGGVFAPNNPMLGVLGDNTREYEVAAPESMLRDTFLEALDSSGVLSRSQGSSSGPVKLNMVLDGQTFARLVVPYLKGENARLGVDILNR